MNKPLYALHSDLEMIAMQVQTLSLSLNKLDWIIQRIKRLDDELTCQGEQMRRMEEQMKQHTEQMRRMDKEISKIAILETNIGKIMAHLKIK